MKFLISLAPASFGSLANSSPHIEFHSPGSELGAQLGNSPTVDVWICQGQEVNHDLLDRWLDHASHIPKSLLVANAAAIPRLQKLASGRIFEIKAIPDPQMKNECTLPREELILRDAEMLYARGRAYAAIERINLRKPPKANVLLVGAGIVNLMTAELLATRGYSVRVVDAGPDPRRYDDWTALGITNGGGNARMFTHTEADNYNEKPSEIYQNMQSIFRRTARNGGWSLKLPESFSAAELAWVNAFEQTPTWMARVFRENMHEVNRQAGEIWKEYMKSTPELFQDVEFRSNIQRLYAEQHALDAAIKLTRQLGTIVDEPSTDEFLGANPGFRSAADSDHLAGGITVQGFTVNIHPFVAKLIGRVTDLGGEFVWNCEVHGIQRNVLGEVTVLESQMGLMEADHFVVSPGVSKNALLGGTASENMIQGVLGVWLQIPNLHPQTHQSIKIHRRGHLVEDVNITVAKDTDTGEDILQFGGGYGYVGLDGRPSADSPELMALFHELEEVARMYFPQGHAVAKERGTLWPKGEFKFCLRPFTPTGLGLFETIPTAENGVMIITGGNNTGGFAQAPAVARAVLRALEGEHDPIHVLFHPDRGRLPTTVTYKSRFPASLSLRSGSAQAREPLRLLVLCSDGPQHSYLRHQLDQILPGYRCILETNDGQLRQLIKKRRWIDAFYMKYHGLRRYYSGHDQQRKAYFSRLVPENRKPSKPDLTVDSLNCSEVWKAVEAWQPEVTIVSGTKYIGRKLNQRAGLMINLHIGHLPEYKGNHCVFFALYDGAVDKVAATLHQLTLDLDGGDVLDKVSPPILPSDTEETLYTRCVHRAMDRVIEHVENFSRGKTLAFFRQANTGKTYRHRDRTIGKEMWLWWKLTVGGLLRNYWAASKASKALQ